MSVFDEMCPDEPLPLIILVKGSDTETLRTLAKAAIPMLLRPEKFSTKQRSQMAENFRRAVKNDGEPLEDTTEWNEQEYEPGECLDWEEG